MVLAVISTGTVMADPVAAASTNVTSDMTSAQIQSIIDGSSAGDTINFLAGVYSNISLSIKQGLNLIGNGATLIGNSTINAVLSVANATGVNINGFNIIGNGSAYGIYFSNVNSSSIASNNVSNTSKYGVYVTDSGNLTNYNNVSIDNNKLLNTTGGIYASGAGINVTNNYIDLYNSSGNGLSGSWYSVLIQNNVILNGGAGLSTTSYKNLTVNNNTIANMTRNYGDAISLVNMAPETGTSTTITNNIIDTNVFGIFIGGYFTGNISGNSINSSSGAGMNITGKHSATSGNLYANITNNSITNSNIGVAMENPDVEYLYFDYNNISSTGANIAYNTYYKVNGTVDMGSHNNLSNYPTYQVNASLMNNSQIQAIIDNAGAGDTIEFLAGVYSNISLNINKALNLVSDGATLIGDGSNAVFTITGSNASGTNMSNFIINGSGSNGIDLINTQGINIANNILQNCTSAIGINGSGNLNIHDNNLSNSRGGVSLSDGYYNVSLKDNNYTGTTYPVVESNIGTSTDGTFTDPSKEVSNVSVTSSYSSSSVTNGKTTTYTVKVSNNGKSSANSVKLSNFMLSSTYAGYKVVAVSKGSFNSTTGTWNVDNLSSGSDAMIVFTVTAKKAGNYSSAPSATFTDNAGNKTVNAAKSSLTINKNVSTSYSYAISSTKVKKGSYFYITITMKNSGLDTSNAYSVRAKLTNAFLKLSTTQTSPFKYSTSGVWTGSIGSSKTIVLKKKIKMAKKGKYTIPIIINGKTVKTYTITGY